MHKQMGPLHCLVLIQATVYGRLRRTRAQAIQAYCLQTASQMVLGGARKGGTSGTTLMCSNVH